MDISMCSGRGCEKKDECYRHTAKPNEFRQSYFTNPPIEEVKGVQVCDYFWDNGEKITNKNK